MPNRERLGWDHKTVKGKTSMLKSKIRRLPKLYLSMIRLIACQTVLFYWHSILWTECTKQAERPNIRVPLLSLYQMVRGLPGGKDVYP